MIWSSPKESPRDLLSCSQATALQSVPPATRNTRLCSILIVCRVQTHFRHSLRLRRPPGLPSQAPHCILSVSCSQARCPSPQLLIKSLSSTPGALWVCINPHSILVNTSFSLIGWRRLNSPRLDLCGAGPFGRRGITRHVQAVSVKGYFRGKCLKCVKVRCEQCAVEVWYWTALVPGLWQQAGLVLAFQFVLTFGFILKFWLYALTVCPFWLSDTRWHSKWLNVNDRVWGNVNILNVNSLLRFIHPLLLTNWIPNW